MLRIEMHFYATKTPDGKIHVQNVIRGMLGQHHVHNKQSFDRWRKGIKDNAITIEEGTCDCGLNVGQVREHDGRVWSSDRFLKDDKGAK